MINNDIYFGKRVLFTMKGEQWEGVIIDWYGDVANIAFRADDPRGFIHGTWTVDVKDLESA